MDSSNITTTVIQGGATTSTSTTTSNATSSIDDIVKYYVNIYTNELKTQIEAKANASNVYTKAETESLLVGSVVVTYAELKQLATEGKLVEGKKYIINDYQTMLKSNCYFDYPNDKLPRITASSLGWEFNILVTAITKTTLDACASVLPHDATIDAKYPNMGKWEIQYDINNDVNKYDWCNPNGKGVIYHMKDEYGNECGYDFKSIVFAIDVLPSTVLTTKSQALFTKLKTLYIEHEDTPINKFFTFTKLEEGTDEVEDLSCYKSCTLNNIGECCVYDTVKGSTKLYLPYMILMGEVIYGNTFSSKVSNALKDLCICDVMVGDIINNQVQGFYSNIVGDDFEGNRISGGMSLNTLMARFANNNIVGHVSNSVFNSEITSIMAEKSLNNLNILKETNKFSHFDFTSEMSGLTLDGLIEKLALIPTTQLPSDVDKNIYKDSMGRHICSYMDGKVFKGYYYRYDTAETTYIWADLSELGGDSSDITHIPYTGANSVDTIVKSEFPITN